MPIRDALPADAESIARVHVDTWRSAYHGIVPQAYLDGLSYETRANYWRGQLARQGIPDADWTLLVAEEDGQVVGFAGGSAERSGNVIYTGELGAIYLLESYQRRGIGRRMVAAMAARLLAQGHAAMLAWVLAENPACGFCEALGGRFIGRQVVRLGGADLDELAYGWEDIRPLAEKP